MMSLFFSDISPSFSPHLLLLFIHEVQLCAAYSGPTDRCSHLCRRVSQINVLLEALVTGLLGCHNLLCFKMIKTFYSHLTYVISSVLYKFVKKSI